MDFNPEKLIRKNIAGLVPYSSAREEYSGKDAILMDANENPFNRPLNRYPDPLQRELKEQIGEKWNISPDMLFLGNGSDEAIDLLFRAFCTPSVDEVISIDPSYGMYEVLANINDVPIKKVLLKEDFSLDSERISQTVTDKTKIIFLCSPNNPTSNLLDVESMRKLAESFRGIVVVDEAYIEFSGSDGMLPYVSGLKNLVILRTLSKSWGLAGIRLGMAIAHPAIISILNRIKYPYNVNVLTQQKALEVLESREEHEKWIQDIISERKSLSLALTKFGFVEKIYPSSANFLLVKVEDAAGLYNFLKENKLIIRDRSKVPLCKGCLRITVGTPEENKYLIDLLKKYAAGMKY